MERINEYRRTDAVNQSFLISLSRGVASFHKQKKRYHEEKPHFLIGSLFDVLITAPEYSGDLFLAHDLESKPSDAIMSIVHRLYDKRQPLFISDYTDDEIIIACDEEGYASNWLRQTRIDKIKKEGANYYDQLTLAKKREIVSNEEYEFTRKLADEFRNHPHVSWIYKLTEIIGVEVLFQYPVYWKERETDCKGLLDIVIVNNRNIPIIALDGKIKIPPRSILPIDIKTLGGFIHDFPMSVKSRRYDVQGAWYSRGLERMFPAYTILNFHFLIKTKTTNEPPMFFVMTDEDLAIGRWGGYKDMYNQWRSLYYSWDHDYNSLRSFDTEIMGWEQMLTLYQWHLENDVWDIDKKIYLSKGLINGVL